MIIVNEIPENDLKFILDFINNFDTSNYYRFNKSLEFEFIGRGCYGHVIRYKNYAIKISNEGSVLTDGFILEKLQDLEFVPKLYCYDEDGEIVIMEYINGKTLDNLINNNILFDMNILYSIENQYHKILERNICPKDLHGGNVLIDTNNKPIIIDFGSYYEKEEAYKNFLNSFDLYEIECLVDEFRSKLFNLYHEEVV